VLSVIIPVLNEAAGIEAHLMPLQPIRANGHELIVVDGGSNDKTVQLSEPLVDQICLSKSGRSRQMNRGASMANGDILLFLHADTQLPVDAIKLIETALCRSKSGWGRFDVTFTGNSLLLRIIATMMNWRSALTGVATGDQVLFMRRELFEQHGGYAKIPLMEDIEISKRLRKEAPPLRIATPVITSSRRWEQRGVLKTILLMWQLRLAYFLGVDPALLALRYR
jgi:rSAM/selenodomain-associated transferase 2